MLGTYRAILKLYPPQYREEFGPEMIATFMQAEATYREKGSGQFNFAVRELAGLLTGALREWLTLRNSPDLDLSQVELLTSEISLPTDAAEMHRRLKRLIHGMQFAIANHNFPMARRYSNAERILREQLRKIETA